MLKKHVSLFIILMLACVAGCSSQEGQVSQNSSGNSTQATEKNSSNAQTQGANSARQEPTPDEGQWVTTQIETGVFGPDGKQKRWVKLVQGKPIKLGQGEYVTYKGTKYTGRAGGRSQIRLEEGELKADNVDMSPEK